MPNQLFYGRLSSVSPVGNASNGYIRVRGDYSNGSNVITNVTNESGYIGIDSIRVGQRLRASGVFGSGVTITAVDVSAQTITVESNAAAASTALLTRISPAEGEYFITGSALQDPAQLVDFSDITGSEDNDYDGSLSNRYGILLRAERGGSEVAGRFHAYEILNVNNRNGANSEADLYVRWAESGSEAGSGDTARLSVNQNVAIVEFNNDGLLPIFKTGIAANFDLTSGEEFAAYQIAIADGGFYDNVETGSGGGGSGNGFPFVGDSAEITGSLNVSGSVTIIDGTLGIPGFPNLSASIAAISGSGNSDAFTSASVGVGANLNNQITFTQAGGGTRTVTIATGSIFSTEGTGILSSSAQINLLGGLTTSSILNFDTHVSSAAAEAGFGAGAGLGGTEVISGSEQIADLGSGIISSSLQLTLLGFTSGSGSFIHTQSSAATTWNIAHNRNQQYVNVTVYDGSDQVVLPSTITATDEDNMEITFPSAQTGYAVIGLGGPGTDGSSGGAGIFQLTGSAYSTDKNLIVTGSFEVFGGPLTIDGFPDVSASMASFSASIAALASSSGFVHVQQVASTQWDVNHENNNQYPTVTVYDSDNEVVIPQSILAVDANNLRVTFPTAMTGYVAVQAGTSQFLSSLGTNTVSGSLNIAPLTVNSTDDLLMVNGNSASLQIASDGVMTIDTNNGLPNPILGGIVFSGSALYIGTD